MHGMWDDQSQWSLSNNYFAILHVGKVIITLLVTINSWAQWGTLKDSDTMYIVVIVNKTALSACRTSSTGDHGPFFSYMVLAIPAWVSRLKTGHQVGVVSKWEWLESQMCFRWLKVALWAILETATQRELEFQVVPWARYHLYSNCDCEIISSTWKVLIFDVVPIVSI